MGLWTLDDQFLDSNDLKPIPLTIFADVQTDKVMNTQSVEIKSVVAHFASGDVQILQNLTEGTIGIFETAVAEKYEAYWANRDAAS